MRDRKKKEKEYLVFVRQQNLDFGGYKHYVYKNVKKDARHIKILNKFKENYIFDIRINIFINIMRILFDYLILFS